MTLFNARAVFLEYVRQQLVPTLRKEDIVVMDNLSSHKVAGVKEAIESVGAEVLYLPPYRADVVLKRAEWKQLQEVIDFKRFVFIDETWAKTNMTPLYGYSRANLNTL